MAILWRFFGLVPWSDFPSVHCIGRARHGATTASASAIHRQVSPVEPGPWAAMASPGVGRRVARLLPTVVQALALVVCVHMVGQVRRYAGNNVTNTTSRLATHKGSKWKKNKSDSFSAP